MTTARFAVFAIADIANSEQTGEIRVADDGAITLIACTGSPSARLLDAAVDELRKARSLKLRSESMREGHRIRHIHEVSPGESLYAAAVADILSCRYGFRCVGP